MSERVNSPSHYKRGGIEAADVIDAFDLGRWEAQAVQYVLRARFKEGGEHELEDLQKAVWFLNRRIRQLQPRGVTVNDIAAALQGMDERRARQVVGA